ncbi:hypothetical protein [Streptomyces sp. SAS_270]|uniref:hypothetical protein n=1 Tax=Streptomyces sp. SAS_270 TaxID=3412748 RepID=UPI00403C17B7
MQRIYHSFTDRANPAEASSAAELGNKHVVDAFDEFASNWKIHRKDLAEQSYDTVDSELAAALRRQDAKAKQGKGTK